jgi:hypothetical protein
MPGSRRYPLEVSIFRAHHPVAGAHMSAPDGQALADYSRGNQPSRGAEERFAEPISGSRGDRSKGPPGGSAAAGRRRRRWGLAGTRGLLAIAGLAGVVALIAADLSTLYEIRVGEVVMNRVTGHAQHDFALLLLGLVALAMLAVALRGSRVAMLALTAVGVAAVLAGPVADRHDVSSTGLIGDEYAGATAHAGAGCRLEAVGAVLLVAAGGGLLIASAAGRPRPRLRRGRSDTSPQDSGPPALAANPYAADDAS